MPCKSRWSVLIPDDSIPSFIFGAAGTPLPDRVALADASRPFTHHVGLTSWNLWSRRVAAGLRNAALQPEDQVLLVNGNTLVFSVVLMAVRMAGGIFTGANPTYVVRELAHQLRYASAALVVATDDAHGCLATAIEAAEQVGLAPKRVFLFDDEMSVGKGASRLGVWQWNALVATEGEGEAFVPGDLGVPQSTDDCLSE